MAEGLEVRITTPGMEKFGELRDNVRKFKKELQDLIPGTDDFAKKSREISTTQDRVNNALRQGWSESAKMKDAYFKTGLEVRQLVLGSGMLRGEMGKLSDSIGLSVMNAMQLRRALAPLGFAMTGFGVGLAAVVGLAPAIIDFFNESEVAARKNREEVEKLNKE